MVLAVGVGDAVLLNIQATSLSLGGVMFTVAAVDARAQILSVELGAEVVLVDLLLVFTGSLRRLWDVLLPRGDEPRP